MGCSFLVGSLAALAAVGLIVIALIAFVCGLAVGSYSTASKLTDEDEQ